MFRISFGIVLFTLFINPAQATDYDAESARQKARIVGTKISSTKPASEKADRIIVDLKILNALDADMPKQEQDMLFLMKTFKLKTRGYYTSNEHDQVERLLFRFLMVRESLWDLVMRYSDFKNQKKNPEIQAKEFIIAFNAALHLTYYSSRLVVFFMDEPEVIEKLNESYYRCEIPEGTFDKLFLSVTDIDNLEAIRTSWEIFVKEETTPQSRLARLIKEDPLFKALANQISRLYVDSDIQVKYILEKKSLLMPSVSNRLRHSAISALSKEISSRFSNSLYAAQSLLFERVSRLKTPFAKQLAFSPDQLLQVKALLQPGDIILTFTDGYMSNVFLPGMFKHGIVYVGSVEQRRRCRLVPENKKITLLPAKKRLTKNLAVDTLPNGYPADVIESVSEGVIFNSLSYIAETHLTRMVVLRPRISSEERIQQLVTVFQLLGNTYDFDFDFNDATSQCCTELIYRSLHKKGPISFSLTKRAGKQTLSADDIIDYHLSCDEAAFEFVLLAKSKPTTRQYNVEIMTGRAGKKAFRSLMH